MTSRGTPAWPVDTLLICMRNARRDGNWGGTRGNRAERAQGSEPQPPEGYEKPTLQSGVPLYPFTKGIDLTNDGLGYGEETRLRLRLPDGSEAIRIARRTRTGSRRFGRGFPESGAASGNDPHLAPSPSDETSFGRPETIWTVDVAQQPEDTGAGQRAK